MSSVKNEKGSVLVFITLMIVLLMIMVGMGLDTGELVYTRSTGQAAVDAAALSAVTALPAAIAKSDDSQVKSRAAAFASTNNYTGSSKNQIGDANVSYVKYDFLNNKVTDYNVALASASGVRVALEADSAMKTPAFLTPLMKLFGSNSAASGSNNVSVSAVSVITARASIPIALWSSQCGLPVTAKKSDVQIKMQPPGSETACWTTYLDKSSGSPDIKALFDASGSCSDLPIGDVDIGIPIYENKGGVTSVFDTAQSFFEDPLHTGRCWLLPVITPPVGGNCNIKDPTPIVDWAQLCYTKTVVEGKDKYIQGDITCGKSLNNTPDSLCYSNRLVREPNKGM